ncbi:MAG: type I secretion system permease/ATPase [Pseudomonadota bacterium]
MKIQKPKTELRQAVDDLRPYFKRAFLFSFFASILVLAPSAYMLEVYDRVVNSRNHVTLVMLTLVVIFSYVIMEMLEWARDGVLHQASHVLDRKMSHRVFDVIFAANLARLPGGTVQVMNDFRVVREFLNTPILPSLMEAPVALTFLVLIFAMSPVLGWSAVVGAVVQVFVAWLNERATLGPLTDANRSAIAAQSYADNSLRNAEVIESMGMLRNIYGRWMERQREFLKMQARASESAGIFQSISKLLQNIMGSLLLGVGCWLLMQNELNGGAGMMIIGSVLGGRVLAPLVQIIAQWRLVINFRDAWGRLDSLLQIIPERPATMELPVPSGRLQADALVAAAPGSNIPIIRNASFSLEPGEVLAVVGPSASGKTTLARLLVGIWPSLGGKVRLDGADVYAWDKTELGPHVGYLPQGVELFAGSVAENIARFGEVEMHKVEGAAQLVGLHEFILTLPQGYETQVGPEGARLSGGQRQRVGLARALYGDPVYVVLDEPNSSLDDEGDAALASAILQLKARGTTFVAVTHRTSLLGVADKMLVIRDGIQQLFGPRDAVLAELAKANTPPAPAPAQGPSQQGPLIAA